MPQSTSPQGKPLVLWKAASGEPNLRMPALVLAVEFLWNMGHWMSQNLSTADFMVSGGAANLDMKQGIVKGARSKPRKNQPQRFPF